MGERAGLKTLAEGGRPDRTTLAAFALLIVAAGGNGVAIRYTYEELHRSPFWSGAIRFLLAAILFSVIARVMGVAVPRGRALVVSVAYGVLTFGAGFGLIYRGLVDAPAGLSQVLLACIPLLTLILASAYRLERFRLDALIGAALAMGGIAIIFVGAIDEAVPAGSMILILGGALAWAQASIVVKKFPPVHPAAMNAAGMAAGGLILLIASAIAGEPRPIPVTALTWGSQIYLVVVGSITVFALVLFVLQRWTASAASFQYPLFPLVTVTLSAWLQDERITTAFLAGSILVLAGVYLGALRRGADARAERATRSTTDGPRRGAGA